MDALQIEIQMLTSALGIIWLGANASLRRPPSAAHAKKADGSKKGDADDEDKFIEGLVASDAIMFPLMAGCVLIGLYYLIEWLQDPDLLNKILRVYLSVMSVASLTRLCADSLSFLVTLVFPTSWADRAGNLHRINGAKRAQYMIGTAGEETRLVQSTSPLPGLLSRLAFSERTGQALWTIRHFLLSKKWTVRISFLDETLHFRPTDVLGLICSLVFATLYHVTDWIVLSNLLGAGFSYAAFSMMSPTSFVIGTMVLAGLFVYDIVMVFYTYDPFPPSPILSRRDPLC